MSHLQITWTENCKIRPELYPLAAFVAEPDFGFIICGFEAQRGENLPGDHAFSVFARARMIVATRVGHESQITGLSPSVSMICAQASRSSATASRMACAIRSL